MVNSVDSRNDVYVLNYCGKHLARDRGAVIEPWRFPIVDAHFDGDEPENSYRYDDVTFVYDGRQQIPPYVSVIGTFAKLYEPIPLRRVQFVDEPSQYFAVTVKVPRGEIHYYKFIVDGVIVLDPVNPQRETLDNGVAWSRFITRFCTQPINFERWEYDILVRLTAHILPFQTGEGENFLKRYYFTLDRQARRTQIIHAYRLDNSIGVVNFIDDLLSCEERHRLIDYKICLSIIRDVLRQRQPGIDTAVIPRQVYVDLYEEMATDQVAGWDYQRYGSPRFFLQLLRRHAITGAFAHPKYGGNAAATGWAFLSERYVDADDATLFAWRRAIERPLGENVEYRG